MVVVFPSLLLCYSSYATLADSATPFLVEAIYTGKAAVLMLKEAHGDKWLIIIHTHTQSFGGTW